MKKILSLVLSLLLCLSAATALADVVPFESLGATIDIPSGMILQEGEEINPEVVEATGAFAAIVDEANQAFVLFTYTEDAEVTAMDLTSLSQEEINILAASAILPYEAKQAMVAGVGGQAWLAITFLDDANVEQNVMVQFGDGGFVVISFRMADNSQMPDAVGATLAAAVASLSFVPAE